MRTHNTIRADGREAIDRLVWSVDHHLECMVGIGFLLKMTQRRGQSRIARFHLNEEPRLRSRTTRKSTSSTNAHLNSSSIGWRPIIQSRQAARAVAEHDKRFGTRTDILTSA